MNGLSQDTRIGEAEEGRWSNFWIAAAFVSGVSGLLQWVVLPSGGTLAEIAEGVQVAASVIGVCAVFRWAVLHERVRAQGRPDDEAEQEP